MNRFSSSIEVANKSFIFLYVFIVSRVENEESITDHPNKHNSNERNKDSNTIETPASINGNRSRDSASQHDTTANLTVRNLHSLRDQHQPMTNGDCNPNLGNNSTIALDSDSEVSTQNQSHRRSSQKNPSHAKFEAFGSFIASSLIDLPEKNALELVERFTREIVKTLIASKESIHDND